MTRGSQEKTKSHVVIVGGGFGGLYAAKSLGRADARVTVIDKRNFHLFQPLLYQVATGGLSPGDIASPLRAILKRRSSVSVVMGLVTDIDPRECKLTISGKVIRYDSAIIATGITHHYFGANHWAKYAPGLKTVEDALEIRQRIFLAFELAEKSDDPETRKNLMTIVVVGAGATGVELAGAIGELTRSTLKNEFKNIDTREARIILVESEDRPLTTFPQRLSRAARRSLEKLGVTVMTETKVIDLKGNTVTLQKDSIETQIFAGAILWAAGVKASSFGELLRARTQAPVDRIGRFLVNEDLSLPGFPNHFVIGDLANFSHQTGKPLPGVAPVAMQQGKYVAKLIIRRLQNKSSPAFRYVDKGSLAVIGRNSAVADFGKLKFSGFMAWLIWILVHIRYLIEFDNKALVLFQWAWNYITRKRGARLITNVAADSEADSEENSQQ